MNLRINKCRVYRNSFPTYRGREFFAHGKLKDNHYKIAIATSSDRHRIERILKDILPLFYYIICGDEVVHGKPHPDIFLKASQNLHVKPEETLVLEDSESGILAAYNGQIDVICIPDMKYPSCESVAKSKCILSNLLEVKEYIKRIPSI